MPLGALANGTTATPAKNDKPATSTSSSTSPLDAKDLALAEANTAIKLHPEAVKPLIERGSINKCSGRLKQAILDYTCAIDKASAPAATAEQKSLLSEAYALRSETYAALKQNDKAIADISIAIKLTPDDLSLVKQRGHVYYNTMQYQKALADYTLLIQKSPQRADYLTWRAHTYEQLGQYYNELSDYTDAIDLYPYKADLWQSRAYVLYKVGLLDLALRDCKVADLLEPSNTNQSYTASYVHEDRGEFEEALKYKEKILEAEKKSANAWSATARLNQALTNLFSAALRRVQAHELGTPIERAEMLCCNALYDFTDPAPQHPDKTITGRLMVKPVELPFYYDDGQHICIQAKINGRTVDMMLDTGCGHSDLWQDKLSDIAKLEETKLSGRMANGKEFEYGYVRVKDMELGTLPLKNVALTIQKGLPKHKTLSGFLGGNIIEHMAVTIDYDKKTVNLNATGSVPRSERAIVVPMIVRNHQPLCIITLDDQIERLAMLDSGCPQGMAPYALIKPIIRAPLTFDQSIKGPWLGDIKSKEIRIKSLGFNENQNRYTDLLFDVFKEEGAVNAAHEVTIGNDFLSCFSAVTFDYPSRRLILEPRAGESKSAIAIYYEARYQLNQEQYQKAIELFTKSLPGESVLIEDNYYYRAKAYLELKQYKKALDDLSSCIKVAPKSPWAYYQRARVHHEMKNYHKEIDDLTTSINLDPEYTFAYRNRAEAYEKIGRKDLAKRDRKLGGKY